MTSPPAAVIAAPQPRVRSCPTYTYTSGPDAVELAAGYGLVADPWQADALGDALGERDDGRWAAYEYAEVLGRQNGKGGIIEIRCLSGLHLFGEKQIMWSSHRWDTAMKMFKRMRDHYINWDELRRQVKRVNNSHGQEGIELLNGAELKFGTRSKDGGRGLSGDLVVIDEAYAFDDGQADAMIPIMSARISATEGGPQIWYHSSPPLAQIDASTGDDERMSRTAGLPMYRLRKRAHAGDPRLCYRDWSALDKDLSQLADVDLDDPELVRRSNPALDTGRMSMEWIQTVERPQMSAVGYARERLCLWPPEPTTLANDVLDPEQWAARADPTSQVDGDVAIAIAVTLDRRWSSIGLYGRRADGLGHLELIDHREGTDWVVARVAELCGRYSPVGVGVDLRGPAGALAPDLADAGITPSEDPDAPQRGDLVPMTATDTAQACGQLVDAVRQDTDRHRDQAQLNTAVGAARTRTLGGALAWAQRAGVVDSQLPAVTSARWVYITRAHRVVDEYDPQAFYV
jgi:hypothetical protein